MFSLSISQSGLKGVKDFAIFQLLQISKGWEEHTTFFFSSFGLEERYEAIPKLSPFSGKTILKWDLIAISLRVERLFFEVGFNGSVNLHFARFT